MLDVENGECSLHLNVLMFIKIKLKNVQKFTEKRKISITSLYSVIKQDLMSITRDKDKKIDNYSICFSIDAVACFFKRQYLNNLTMKYKNIFSSVFQEDMRVRCLFLSEARPSLVRSHSSKPKRRWPKHHLGLKKGS